MFMAKKAEDATEPAAKAADAEGRKWRARALVTGATGHIGTLLVKALMERNYRVRALVRNAGDAKRLPDDVEFAIGDITKPETLKGACEGVNVVFHLAALIDYKIGHAVLQAINGRGTANIVKEAASAGVGRIVHMSSIAVYGRTERGRPLKEDDQLMPTDDYGASKLAGEQSVRYGGVPFVILRPGIVYGPGFEEGFLPVFKMLKRRALPYMGSGQNNIPFVHVHDVVRALILAAEKETAVGETYNIVGRPVTQKECFLLAANFLDVPGPRLHAPPRFLRFMLGLMNWVQKKLGRKPKLVPEYIEAISVDRSYETDKAMIELGWEPREELENGIAQMVAHFRELRKL